MQTLRLKRILWLFVGIAALACTERQAFSVDGVQDKFCVPKGYPPQGVWFVPKDTPNAPYGFSFMGCKLLSEALQRTCTLPARLSCPRSKIELSTVM